MKINNFRGELTDISAKKEALTLLCARARCSGANTSLGPSVTSCIANCDFVFTVILIVIEIQVGRNNWNRLEVAKVSELKRNPSYD